MSLLKGKTRNVNNTDVEKILKKAFGDQCKISVTNREYLILDKNKINKFVEKEQKDRLLNRNPLYCVDFSRILIGRALECVIRENYEQSFGITFGEVRGNISVNGKDKPEYGSYVVYICLEDLKHKVYVLDPKTDEYFYPNQLSSYEIVFI